MFTYKIDSNTTLTLLEDRHTEIAYALINQNREHLGAWMPWAKPGYSLEDCRAYIRQTLQRMADHNGFDAAIFYRGEMAGQIGYNGIDWPNRATEIGYWLGASFQGKGLITTACRALLDHAFYELKLNRVEIRCAVENTRSRAVPERLGFRQDGILRQVEWLHDRFVDLVVYSMLAGEWPRLRQS